MSRISFNASCSKNDQMIAPLLAHAEFNSPLSAAKGHFLAIGQNLFRPNSDIKKDLLWMLVEVLPSPIEKRVRLGGDDDRVIAVKLSPLATIAEDVAGIRCIA